MVTTTLSINIDNDLRDKAQAAFEPLGIDMSTAVNVLLRKLLYLHEIPLDSLKIAQVEKKDRRAAFGCLRGKIHVPEDFNEPLDDFKEYM